jgi:hypothetical protein
VAELRRVCVHDGGGRVQLWDCEIELGVSHDVQVAWEVITRRPPYDGKFETKPFVEQINAIVAGERPTIDSSFSPDVASLCERCWSSSPLERPSFVEIEDEIDDLVIALSKGNPVPSRRKSTLRWASSSFGRETLLGSEGSFSAA